MRSPYVSIFVFLSYKIFIILCVLLKHLSKIVFALNLLLFSFGNVCKLIDVFKGKSKLRLVNIQSLSKISPSVVHGFALSSIDCNLSTPRAYTFPLLTFPA